MTRHPLPTLQGFKFIRYPNGAVTNIDGVTAQQAFVARVDLSRDGVKWYPAFTEQE